MENPNDSSYYTEARAEEIGVDLPEESDNPSQANEAKFEGMCNIQVLSVPKFIHKEKRSITANLRVCISLLIYGTFRCQMFFIMISNFNQQFRDNCQHKLFTCSYLIVITIRIFSNDIYLKSVYYLLGKLLAINPNIHLTLNHVRLR